MRIDNFQMVELIVGAGVTSNNTDIYFQQQPQLQSFNIPNQQVFINAIETYSDVALTNSPLTTSNPVATIADIQNATLTIVEGTSENKKMIPLARLCNTFALVPDGGGGTANVAPPFQFPFQFINLHTVDWTKCYVTVVQTPAQAPFSYLFGVYYSYEPNLY